MNLNSRLFDCLQYQLDKFPKADMLTGKVNGEWIANSTQQVKETVDSLAAGLLDHEVLSGEPLARWLAGTVSQPLVREAEIA